MTGTPDLDGIDPDMEGAVRSALRSRAAAVTANRCAAIGIRPAAGGLRYC